MHLLVWNNRYLELDRELKKKQVNECRGECVHWAFMRNLFLFPCLFHPCFENIFIVSQSCNLVKITK